jgi:hypothetical protein
MQWDMISDQGLWIGAAAVVVIFIGALAAYRLKKPKSHHRALSNVAPQNGWTATGRIDFVHPQSSSEFILQVEETRIVDTMGGVEHREIRWRRATLDEAKTVLVSYHAQRNLTMTANFIVSSPTGISEIRTAEASTRKFRSSRMVALQHIPIAMRKWRTLRPNSPPPPLIKRAALDLDGLTCRMQSRSWDVLRGHIQGGNDVVEMSRTRKRNASKPNAIEQLLGIRMSGRIEERVSLVDFNHPASPHHRDFVAVMSGNAKIRGYDQLRRTSFAR